MDAARRLQLQETLARLAAGDRSAFHPVFELAWPVVRDFARAVLRNETDAEDVAQEALVKLFLRASAFDPGRSALPFVLGFAWNECRTLRKRAGRRREEPLDGAREPGSPDPDPEAQAVGNDLARAARDVLSALPEADVATLLADLEAGPRPSVTPATFRKRLERARRRLREAWSGRHG